jgi:uncharacterized glyoxalase superfamily protein PhnB
VTEGPALHAYLSYRDAPLGLDWLQAVGFEVVARQDADDDRVLHAEVRYGDVVVMVATADDDYDVPTLKGLTVGGGLYLWFPTAEEVDDWHARAAAAGAETILAPGGTEWGTRRARVLDPEGHEWSAGTHGPGAGQ